MEISFPHFRKQLGFDDDGTTCGQRAKYFLFFITQLVQFRPAMTASVLADRLTDLGYQCDAASIAASFENDPDVRPSKSRRATFEITHSGRGRILALLRSNRHVYLSHASADKPLVRRISHHLKHIGLDTWFDEEALHAGRLLDRSLLEGMQRSCAVVFFLTSAFEDSDFLSREIDYALLQQRAKGDRFQVIVLVLASGGVKGRVPALLKPYVWKEPASELDIVEVIVSSIPLKVGVVGWQERGS
jgi:hypothetical protein